MEAILDYRKSFVNGICQKLLVVLSHLLQDLLLAAKWIRKIDGPLGHDAAMVESEHHFLLEMEVLCKIIPIMTSGVWELASKEFLSFS